MRSFYYSLVAILFAATLAGCASMFSHQGARQAGSIVDYLYPDAKEAPNLQPGVTYLRPPVRVGIAFVPGTGYGAGLPEAEKTRLLEHVRASFSQYNYIGDIQIIPSNYLRPRGGFANLDQIASMFNVEVVALVSYDQIGSTIPMRSRSCTGPSSAPTSSRATSTTSRPWWTPPCST